MPRGYGTLARAGRPVTLVDKATFPRDKVCGDGLTTGALRLLDGLGLRPEDVASWQRVDDVVVRSPSGVEALFPMPRDRGTYAAVSRRTDLDAALVDVARRSGVKVVEGHACTGVTEDADGATVSVEGHGDLRVAWVVAADGMWSPVRKSLGLATPGYRGEWPAFRQYLTHVGPRAQRELFVWFEPDLLPGYAWSFPLPGGVANVGFGIVRGGKVGRVQDMAGIWRDLLSRPHIRSVLGGDSPALVTATYRQPARRALVADHRMSTLLMQAVRHRKGVRAGLRLAGATGWTRRNFARWLFEDYPRALVATPRRWHHGMFTGP